MNLIHIIIYHSSKIPFNIIISSKPASPFPLAFSATILYPFIIFLYKLNISIILASLTSLPQQFLLKSENGEDPHYGNVLILLSILPA
jgi:hypothetical protein